MQLEEQRLFDRFRLGELAAQRRRGFDRRAPFESGRDFARACDHGGRQPGHACDLDPEHFSDSATSSWKCVANSTIGARDSRSSRYSQIACAIDRPSTVPVPRPISSISSKLRSVARRRMLAASDISM
jgi:hypothetical protein